MSVSDPQVKPNVIPKTTFDQSVAQAQRILDLRGKPPYTPQNFTAVPVTQDEVDLIWHFVHYWMPHISIKEKRDP